jgi:inhibitor of KinA sporulation pathway (predicted exonuclease)
MKNHDYLVIDLEATCDDGGGVPRHEMEIIEIGAVIADGQTLEPRDEFQTFVRPVRHPQLTPFCTQLTSITRQMLADAPGFVEALARLRHFMGSRALRFCSWGAYDRNQLRQDAAYHGVELPFGRDHLNLKTAFGQQSGTTKKFGMGGALRRVGLELRGTHHRGIDDARNIARLLPYCLGRRPLPGRGLHGRDRR